MTRRTGQVIALMSIILLIVFVSWYQMSLNGSLKGSVLTSDDEYGYGYEPEEPAVEEPVVEEPVVEEPVVEEPVVEEPAPSVPTISQETGVVMGGPTSPEDVIAYTGGFNELYYTVEAGSRVELDALLMPAVVPSLETVVLWTPDKGANYAEIVIDDPGSAQTFFMAPRDPGQIIVFLEARVGSREKKVASYIFTVTEAAGPVADVDGNGIYDFTDLVNLLQNWDSFGPDATRVLAIILSEYQGE